MDAYVYGVTTSGKYCTHKIQRIRVLTRALAHTHANTHTHTHTLTYTSTYTHAHMHTRLQVPIIQKLLDHYSKLEEEFCDGTRLLHEVDIVMNKYPLYYAIFDTTTQYRRVDYYIKNDFTSDAYIIQPCRT